MNLNSNQKPAPTNAPQQGEVDVLAIERWLAGFESSASLQDIAVNARRKLSEQNVRYPNGCMSHDLERVVLNVALDRLADMQIEGYYYADGHFAGYADEARFQGGAA